MPSHQVAHMTKSEIEILDSILVGPTMLFLNQYFNTFLNEYYVLWAAFVSIHIFITRQLIIHLKDLDSW